MSEPINNRRDLLGFQKSYAFLIGINNYPKINANLKSAVNDARALAQVLKYRQGFDHVELLIDPNPEENQEELQKELEGIQVKLSADGATFRDMLQRIQDPEQEPKINPQDCIVFYYAGHGKPGAFEEGPKGYLLPSDAQPGTAMLKNDSLIAMEEVFEALKTLDCHHTLLILDCCFAGKFRYADDSRMGRIGMSNMPLYPERFERYKRERAWQVLVSAGPHQTAADWLGERQELAANAHSPFAEALLEALEGKAELNALGKNRGDGVLTSQELFLYLWDKVERLTKDGHLGDKSQYPDLFPMANHRGGQFIFFDPNNKLNFANRTLRNPYKGLKPFETSDSELFFGRKEVIKKLLPRLVKQPLLVVTAPSGSGKSSLVKAGLFPALTNWQNQAGERPWGTAELFVLRPGSKPWTGETPLPENVPDSKKIVYTGLKALLPLLQKDKKQVLLLDQYEELFTDGAPETERTAFEQALITLHKTATDHQLKIIITLRSDFEWLLEASEFGKTFWKKEANYRFLCRIPPMGIDELREALVSPALAELYDFETDFLVTSILSEVGYSRGALPMLSFTMSRFYEMTSKDERIFTHQGYDDLGGVNGALSQYADEIFEALGEKSKMHQDVMYKLMIRLVKVNDGGFSRRRVYIAPNQSFQNERGRSFLNEFDYSGTQDGIVLEVLEFLSDKQLILAGKDFIGSYYEPVHDSLIQHWKTAKQWITDFGAENIHLQRQLWEAILEGSKQLNENNLDLDYKLTFNFSELWDSNPKLLQILAQVSKAASDYVLANKEAILAEALPQIDPEDQEEFINIWEDYQAKNEVPDLNSLILSGYSDKLLELFLDKGDHWLNQAEAAFIQQSWRKRIESIMDLKAQKERVTTEMMSATWRATTFLDDKDFGYWKGVRDTYENIKVLMDLKKIQSISPVPVFLGGPHIDSFVNDSPDFGHYNPAFLEWVKKYAIPATRNSALRRLTMPFYVKFMKVQIRNYYNVYKYHEANPNILPAIAKDYLNVAEEGAGDTSRYYEEKHALQSILVPIPEERKFENSLFSSVASAFWLRRTLDGTIQHFREIVEKILKTYEPEWLIETDKIWSSPDAYRKEIEEQNQAVITEVLTVMKKANQYYIDRPQPSVFSPLSLYQSFKHLVNLKRLQLFAPVPVFIAGPHGESLNLSSTEEVGQYNPEFLRWLRERGFPFKRHPLLKKLVQNFFERHLKDLARTYYRACQYWEENPNEKTEIVKEYRSTIKDYKSSGYKTHVWREVQYGTEGSSILRATKDTTKYNALGFWIRRDMDRTAELFKDLLLDLLQTYDAEWLSEQL